MSRVTFETVKFAVDPVGRTLTGIVLPFDVDSRPSINPETGKPALWHFPDGTVTVSEDASDNVLNYGHDDVSLYMQIGAATSQEVVPGVGVQATFGIAKTPEGDAVLALAAVKALKSFSAEVEGQFTAEKVEGSDLPLMRAKSAVLTGTAVVRHPAFTGAAITSVAASAAKNKETEVDTIEKTTEETAPVFSKDDGDKLIADVQALTAQLAELKDVKIPVGPGAAQFEVREEPIYRFSGSTPAPSGHDFATDLLAVVRTNDQAALARLQEYTAERVAGRFADQPTTTGDTAALNPNVYRPDLFLGQAPVPASPMFDFFLKGSLSNVNPFYWSKLDRTNTDVAVSDHTEGTDPETRDLVTATVTPVTPVPVSGRVHITREVGDQGGNPAISGLIRNEFDRSFSIACETKTAALVLASSAAELGGAITAGATDGGAVGQIVEAGLVGLQFRDDGFRFEKAFGHIDLYKLLAAAVKGTDNLDKLYPIINPQNATGQAASKWSYLDIGGYRMQPAAKLGATDTNKKSYVADPFAVHVWASGLKYLDKLKETVEGWDVGVFGYFAGVVYDSTGLLKITYDPTA